MTASSQRRSLCELQCTPHPTLQVVVVTPTKNYTVEQQKQLLLDMGDEGGVSGAGGDKGMCFARAGRLLHGRIMVGGLPVMPHEPMIGRACTCSPQVPADSSSLYMSSQCRFDPARLSGTRTTMTTLNVQASLLDDSWARSEALLKRGPVAGLETFCLYGGCKGNPRSGAKSCGA
jgi:hypothetical protein